MAEQKILISIQIQDKAAKKTIDATSSSLNKLATSQKKVAKATDQTRATSGLNNAILMETSRLASDASFGFTAIANNLSQLINLFKASKDATGSFSQSIKSLFTAQSALLIGIQLLITFGDDLFRLFKDLVGSSKLLQETFKDAGSEVQGTAGKFEIYIKTLQDSNKSQEEQADAINRLKKEFPEYLKQLDEANVTLADVANKTEEATKQNDLYRESIIRLAMSRAAQNKIEEEAAKQVQAEIDLEIESGKGKEELIELESRYQDALAEAPKVGAARQKFLEKQFTAEEKRIIRLIKSRNKEVESAEENINALIRFIDIQNNETSKGLRRRNRIFKAADLDFEKETQQSRERLLKGFIKDEKLQIKIKFDGIRERARIKQKEFEDDQKRRLAEFLAVEKDENKRKDAINRVDEEIRKSKESLGKYITQLNAEQSVAIGNLTIEQAQKIIDADRELQYKLQENRQRAADQEILNEGIKAGNLFNLKNEQLEKERQRLELALESENLTFQERMNLQKQLTVVEQQQTDARIKVAELEAWSKRELLDQTANALMAFGNLAGKETGVGKGLAVASTLISTYTAAQKAYESQFSPIPTLNSPVRGALAAAAAVASGLANVKSILSVKTPNDKSQGAGGRVIQAPDFNVVGASQTSQLAEAVSTQQQKPVKAFVVGKDISTQQELDRNTTNTASFG